MIKDQLCNIQRYSPILGKDIIRNIESLFGNGNYNDLTLVDNIKVFDYNYDGDKNSEEIIFESHKKNIDIQIILEGNEIMLLTSLEKAITATLYNSKEDYQLYKSTDYTELKMSKGEFLILFPNEIHSPKHFYSEIHVKRAVIKCSGNM